MTETKRHKQVASVSEVVWRWRGNESKKDPSVRAMRAKGIAPIVATLVIATLFRFVFGWIHSSTVVYGISILFLLITAFIPRWLLSIERGMLVFGRWVGYALTWLLLVPFFYLVFIPLRLIQAIAGSDPMRSNYDQSTPSYWVVREEGKRSSNTEKQF